MEDTVPAIVLSNVRKDFVPPLGLRAMLAFHWRRERVTALDGLDCVFEGGRIHALVGPNGAGKTTLLKLVNGLLMPTEGRIAVLGMDTVSSSRQVRGRVGYCITDSRSFFLRLSGLENLRFFAALHGLLGAGAAGRVDDLVRAMEIETVASRQVLSYSEGMKQRLALARALIHRPIVLLLDEIGRGLDPRMREKTYSMVRDDLVARQGVTVLLASHNMDEVRAVADIVHVMDRGKIVVSGGYEDCEGAIARVFGLAGRKGTED